MGLMVDKCLETWTNSLRQRNAKAVIVFFGDFIIYCGTFVSLFPAKVVCNLGMRQIELFSMEYNILLIGLYSIFEKHGEMPFELTTDGNHLSRAGYQK